MKLYYRLNTLSVALNTTPIIMIHGLFGNFSNLRSLATYLAQYYNIIQIDVRNHGFSPHSDTMDYINMTQDIVNLLNFLSINKCIVIGHSMGGKIAMALSVLATQLIEKIIVIDIAPVKYSTYNYNNIIQSIDYVNQNKIINKKDIINIMKSYLIEQNTILFLLKSFHKGSWIFNFESIKKNYTKINNWTLHQIWQGPSLFIKGSLSNYINDINIHNIYSQFPNAKIHTIPNTNHWVHYENPKYVFNLINKFIKY